MPRGIPMLKPCPFCNHPGEERRAAWTALWRYRCSNRKCPLRPSTPVETSAFRGCKTFEKQRIKARKMWNTRKGEDWHKRSQAVPMKAAAFIRKVKKAHKDTAKSTLRFAEAFCREQKRVVRQSSCHQRVRLRADAPKERS